MKTAKPNRAWGMDQRLEFIEFRLFWEGELSRADLIEKFGISVPQASIDFSRYKNAAASNIEYDASRKRYVPSEHFKPIFYVPNPERYLAQLVALKDGVIVHDDTMFGQTLDVDTVPAPARTVSARKLQKFVQAIKQRGTLSIEYQSMNPLRSEAQWRDISPHAFATDGMRWHVRAYCHLDGKHKDFIISRCIDVGDIKLSPAPVSEDTEWNTKFTVIIAPNPELTDHQKTVIARDFDMKDGRLNLEVRNALLYYFDKRHRFDIADSNKTAVQAPIVITNREEYKEALAGLSVSGAVSSVV
ncbi:hypothetical protein A8B75_18625 [Sphingomonadales bacterium EhC05]|nr:hypothetical protein A8B75_18625 [Sphingomonadales bacterium EhC05]